MTERRVFTFTSDPSEMFTPLEDLKERRNALFGYQVVHDLDIVFQAALRWAALDAIRHNPESTRQALVIGEELDYLTGGFDPRIVARVTAIADNISSTNERRNKWLR